MRPFRTLLIYTLAVFLGGALLAPWVYKLVQTLAPGTHAAQSPFHRYMDRCFLGLALVGIWPLLRGLGATSSWREIGLVKLSGQGRRLFDGFAVGFGSLACVAIAALAAHGRVFNPNLTAARLGDKLAGAAGTAVVVSVLEELLFRGAIFGALRKIWDWRAALLVSSMIYAIVHFMGSPELQSPVTWSSGLELLPRKLEGFVNLEVVIPGFFNLTLAGILLGLAYQKTGNLYFSIGLHAGWIFWLKSYGAFTSSAADASAWFWGTTGSLTAGWRCLFLAALFFFLPGERAKSGERRHECGHEILANSGLIPGWDLSILKCARSAAASMRSRAEGFVCVPCWQKVRFIKPPFCERCGLPYEGDITTAFECGNCRDMELHFRSARSAVAGGRMMLDVIHRYKYQRALWFEPFLARSADPPGRRRNWRGKNGT